MFRKNDGSIYNGSDVLAHRNRSYFFITDFRHFTGGERRRYYLFHIMWNGRELFLLFWRNKRITMTRDDITYRSIWGKEKKYSWEDVRSVRYKSAGRGAYRILIQTDRKIYIETGMMKNSEEAEKLIKEKGYLGLH